jgi:hypothetical protein
MTALEYGKAVGGTPPGRREPVPPAVAVRQSPLEGRMRALEYGKVTMPPSGGAPRQREKAGRWTSKASSPERYFRASRGWHAVGGRREPVPPTVAVRQSPLEGRMRALEYGKAVR